MKCIKYFVYGEGSYTLLIKWLKRLSEQYWICFPVTGDLHTPVINLSNPYSIMKRNGGFREKKVAIHEDFRCIDYNDVLDIEQAIEVCGMIFLVSNIAWKDLNDETRTFLSDKGFKIINLETNRMKDETLKDEVDRILDGMEYSELNFKGNEKYFSYKRNSKIIYN